MNRKSTEPVCCQPERNGEEIGKAHEAPREDGRRKPPEHGDKGVLYGKPCEKERARGGEAGEGAGQGVEIDEAGETEGCLNSAPVPVVPDKAREPVEKSHEESAAQRHAVYIVKLGQRRGGPHIPPACHMKKEIDEHVVVPCAQGRGCPFEAEGEEEGPQDVEAEEAEEKSPCFFPAALEEAPRKKAQSAGQGGHGPEIDCEKGGERIQSGEAMNHPGKEVEPPVVDGGLSGEKGIGRGDAGLEDALYDGYILQAVVVGPERKVHEGRNG